MTPEEYRALPNFQDLTSVNPHEAFRLSGEQSETSLRIIDLIFAIKDEEGTLAIVELNALGDETLAVFEPEPSELSGSLTEDDARSLAGGLENNSSAAIMLFENTWATKFVEAMRNANGQLVMIERVPRAVIDELIAEVAEAKQSAGAPA